MNPLARTIATAVLLCPAVAARADDPPGSSVAAIQAAHDRALIRDLAAYVVKTPRPDDVDQAYMALFNKAIEHDWFLDHEATARAYLKDEPEGPIRPLARIIATMARAQAGAFPAALADYRALIDGLSGDQVEFATHFADSLASAATSAGEFATAREVFEALSKKFGESDPALKRKVADELARLDRVGRPAPAVDVEDIDGKPLRLGDLKGNFVLVDFWATWCAPCLAELPRLQAAEAKYRDKGLRVVSVSLDETKGAVVDFVRVRKLPWAQVHNATCGGDFVQAFGVGSIPATFLIDRSGTIVRLDLRGPSLDKALDALMK